MKPASTGPVPPSQTAPNRTFSDLVFGPCERCDTHGPHLPTAEAALDDVHRAFHDMLRCVMTDHPAAMAALDRFIAAVERLP